MNQPLYLPRLANFNKPHVPKFLTKREHQVLICLWDGLSIKETSIKLGVSFHTVEYHRDNIHRKFGVDNTVKACRVGLQRGYLTFQVFSERRVH